MQAKPAPVNFECAGLLCPFPWRELDLHLTQCGQGRGLPAWQVSSWSVQPLGHSIERCHLYSLLASDERGHFKSCRSQPFSIQYHEYDDALTNDYKTTS